MLASVFQRSVACKPLESLHKGARIVEATVDGDFDYARSGAAQGIDSVKHTHLLHEGVGCHAHALFEDAHEVAFGEGAPPRQFADGDAPAVGGVDVVDGGQQAGQFQIVSSALAVFLIDGDESDDPATLVMQRVFAGPSPLGRMIKETGGMNFFDEWLVVLKNQQVVLAVILGNDAREEVKVGFSTMSKSGGRWIASFSARLMNT